MAITLNFAVDESILRYVHSIIPSFAAYIVVGFGFLFAIFFNLGSGRSSTLTEGHKSSHSKGVDENILKSLWAEALQIDVDNIGGTDNFFHIGGDSMAAAQLVKMARDKRIVLTAPIILKNQTLSAMARNAENLESEEQKEIKPFSLLGYKAMPARKMTASLCELDERCIQDIYPCMPAQASMARLEEKSPGVLIQQCSYRLPSNLDIDKFRAAWEALVESQPILRTRMVKIDKWRLQVVTNDKINWIQEDNFTLEAYLAQDRQKPMKLGQPLTRYTFVGMKTESPHFVWTVHHSLYDGWSMMLLMQALRQRYLGLSLDPVTPFTHVVETLIQSDREAGLKYWKSQLAGIRPSRLPFVPESYSGRTDSEMESKVRLSPRKRSHVTMSIVIRAAWALVLAELKAQDDVVVGLVLNGRTINVPGIMQVAGPTLTLLPVRIRTDRMQAVADYLQQAHNQAVEMIPYEQQALMHLRAIGPEVPKACDFETQLLVHPSSASLRKVTGFLNETDEVEIYPVSFPRPLVIQCYAGSDEIDIVMQYDSKVISPETMSDIMQGFAYVISRLSSGNEKLLLEHIRPSALKKYAHS